MKANVIPTRQTRTRIQRGFSLVELLIAMVIGLIVVGAATALFSTSSSTYQLDTGLARVQENGRFAIEQISYELRRAGDMGCLNLDNLNNPTPPRWFNNLNPTAGGMLDFTRPVEGFEFTNTGPGITYSPPPSGLTQVTAGWLPALDTSLVPTGSVQGSDVLVLRYMDSRPFRRVAPYNDSAQIFLDNSERSNVQAGDIMVLSDCNRASVFQITSVNTGGAQVTITHAASGTPGNRPECVRWEPPGCAEQVYNEDAEFSRVRTVTFFVGIGASGEPALFQGTLGSAGSGPAATAVINTAELIEGVESMQVLYGVDTEGAQTPDGEPDRYVPANLVPTLTGSWGRVVAVRVSMLMRTVNFPGQTAEQTQDTSTYLLAGADSTSAVTYDPTNDLRRRRVFSTTVKLRNRGP